MSKHFTLASFGRHLLEMEVKLIPTVEAVAKEAASEMYDNAHRLYGDATMLAPLAKATQDDRVSKGYTPNNPLLRDGTLLRDSLEKDSNIEGLAGIGSAEPVQKYQEHGYINARTGRAVPPRPVLRLALSTSLPAIRELVDGAIAFILGQSKKKLKP